MKIKGILMATLFLMTWGLGTAVADDSALDQLQGMRNTGVTFDGSDGERSGMDVWTTPSAGEAPAVPEPTPVEPVQTYEPAPEPEPAPVETPTYSEPAPAPEPEPEPEQQGPSTGEEVA